MLFRSTQRIGDDDSIAAADAEQNITSDIRLGITDIGTGTAGIIASITAAPIPDDGIGGSEAGAIGSPQYIGDGKIAEIAATNIIGRSDNISQIS